LLKQLGSAEALPKPLCVTHQFPRHSEPMIGWHDISFSNRCSAIRRALRLPDAAFGAALTGGSSCADGLTSLRQHIILLLQQFAFAQIKE
jgi:hypothetical protein